MCGAFRHCGGRTATPCVGIAARGSQPVACCRPDVDHVAVVHEAVDRAVIITSSPKISPLPVEALVRRQHRRDLPVVPRHGLQEEHRSGAADRQVADLVNHQQAQGNERLEVLRELAGSLGFLQ